MSAGRLFDAYLFVDWSASSRLTRRTPRKDAIWVGESVDPGRVETTYYRGRHEATASVRERLRGHARAARRVVVGFDFPYGYPTGLSAALGLGGSAPWRALWQYLGTGIADDERNRNNRFVVADRMNELLGNGSVGSQALVGIPRVLSLRDDRDLAAASRVWPFEIGFTATPSPSAGPFLLHAEIWPGIVAPDRLAAEMAIPGTIRDQAQVRLMCRWAAERDADGTLGEWFDDPGLDEDDREAVVSEEGWILGCPRVPPA